MLKEWKFLILVVVWIVANRLLEKIKSLEPNMEMIIHRKRTNSYEQLQEA